MVKALALATAKSNREKKSTSYTSRKLNLVHLEGKVDCKHSTHPASKFMALLK